MHCKFEYIINMHVSIFFYYICVKNMFVLSFFIYRFKHVCITGFLKKKNNLVYLQIQQEKHSVKIGKIHYFFLIKSITEKAKYYVTTI